VKGWFSVSAILLAACTAAGGNWTKPGADAAATESAYRECSATAADAVSSEADIDQDIQATRQSDLQRSGAVRVGAETARDQTCTRAARIITACMQAKGFAKSG
jgi:hypothetical protein